MKHSLTAGEVGDRFGLEVRGNRETLITGVGSLSQQTENTLSWIKNAANLSRVNAGCFVIGHEMPFTEPKGQVTFLVTRSKPRFVFAKIVTELFAHQLQEDLKNYVEEHKKNKAIFVGENVFIGKDVVIGEGTIVHPNVVIYPKTRIGKNCVLKTHVSVGTEGLGLELDPDTNEFIKFPQMGGVIIEDNVEIGPTATIRRSALDNTVIGKGTKIGSLVNIGHNCVIGQNCIFTCQIVTAGSSTIGDNVYMGVNSLVKNGVNIGSHATIGQGAVVTRNVPEYKTFVGNPAEDIEDYKMWSKVKSFLKEKFGSEL